jgi:hypothetical protein
MDPSLLMMGNAITLSVLLMDQTESSTIAGNFFLNACSTSISLLN